MGSEINLVKDLAIILIAAGAFTVISKALKQPLILGYIIAGFLVSPHLGLIPGISSMESVDQWSEIGIIFLLFGLGLEFSFKKLIAVGSSALIMAGTIVVGMFIVGATVGQALGFTTMESLFFGGMLSMSSTAIIVKAYDEMGLKSKPYAQLIFGNLVVEDLIAVVMMVLLSTLAVSNKFSGGEMVWNLAKLGFFIILWFLVGIYVIPTVLKKTRRFLNDEILLIISIGLCFGMVALAVAVGFSAALGAFVMGSLLSETIEGEHIEGLVSGIKNLFGAIFFVSVGMMIDPKIIGQYWWMILIIAFVAMCGILIFSTLGALFAGKSLDTAVHAGFTLAQLGEFSFILASLGCSLGVMRDFIYPCIIAVSVLTTFTTPYMIKAADPASRWLHKKLPEKILSKINTSDEESAKGSMAEQSEWKKFLTSYFIRVILYSVILVGIIICSKTFFKDVLTKLLPADRPAMVTWLNVAITLALMSPFLYGLSIRRGSQQVHMSKLADENDSNKWPLLSLTLLRLFIGIGFVLSYISSVIELSWWSVLVIAFVFIMTFSIAPKYIKFSGLEDRFMANLNEREIEQKREAPVTASIKEKMSGYDVHLEIVVMSPDSENIGKKLREMPFREHTGVNIVKIVRGSKSILIPRGDEPIYPYDKLLVVGTSAQIKDFNTVMKEEFTSVDVLRNQTASDEGDFAVESFTIADESFMSHKSLRDLSMRESGCMVLSVLRDTDFTTNPKADFRFLPGDTVWIAGEPSSCHFFK